MMLAWLRAWIDTAREARSAGLLAAVATGETLSPAGAVWPMGLTALLLWGVGRRPEGR